MMYMLTLITNSITQKSDDQRKACNLRILIHIVPTRKSSPEPLHQELLATIHDKRSIRDQPLPKIPPLLPPPPLITPPPYQTPSAPDYSIKDKITRLLKKTKHQSIYFLLLNYLKSKTHHLWISNI